MYYKRDNNTLRITIAPLWGIHVVLCIGVCMYVCILYLKLVYTPKITMILVLRGHPIWYCPFGEEKNENKDLKKESFFFFKQTN